MFFAAAFGAAALSIFATAASAAPPPNDNFDAAVVLTGDSGTTTGTNREATREPGEPTHIGAGGGRSVWYRITPAEDTTLRVETCGPGTFDTVLAVYSGPAVNALTTEGGNDDACGDKSRVTWQARAGVTYHIAVDGLGTTSGNFTLSWRTLRPPANDAFAAAQQISGRRGSTRGSNEGATTEPGETPPEGIGATVWYVWTAPMNGAVTFDTCGGATFDTVLLAYRGESVSSLALVAGSDDACELASRMRLSVRRGTTYRIAVAGFRAGTDGTFLLRWAASTAPANDPFTSAKRIRGGRGAVTGANTGASAEPGERNHAARPASASMWYRWRAPRTMRVSFDTCGSRFDTVLAVYRGTSLRRLRQVAANDDARGSCQLGSRVLFTARRGVQYRIVIDGYLGRVGPFRLRWGRPFLIAQSCRVPDVRGVTLPQARQTLQRAGCPVGRIRYVRSTQVPAGFIAAQRPRPGARIRRPRRVELDVSRGP